MLSNTTDADSNENITDPSLKSVKSFSRFYALDTLRAFIMLLGILLHSILAYSEYRFPAWGVQDVCQHSFYDFILRLIHLFFLESFFLIAGFFANFTLKNKGLFQFVKNRLMRIALPFLLGWPITAMLLLLIPFKQSHTGTTPEIIHIFHLWFLYYLLIFYPIVIVFDLIISFSKKLSDLIDMGFHSLLQSRYFIYLLAGTTLPILLFMQNSYVVETPLGFTPSVRLLLYYGIFFIFGVLLNRQPNLLENFSKNRQSYFYIAIPSIIFLFTFSSLINIAAYPEKMGINLIVYRILFALTTWSLIFSCVGYFQQYFNKGNPIILYFSKASYWLFLAHLPIVVYLQNLLLDTNIPVSLKPLIVFSGSLIILLISYHLMVRNTWIGTLLNGPKSIPVMPILRW